jgi:hypothetical protein
MTLAPSAHNLQCTRGVHAADEKLTERRAAEQAVDGRAHVLGAEQGGGRGCLAGLEGALCA